MEQKLSELGQYPWHFIETHILEIPDYSIVKLSERTNAPTATVVRTTKKKGYGGFTSFKHYSEDREDQNINSSALEKVDRGIRTAILRSGEEAIHTINMIGIGNIEDTIQKIKASWRITIFVRGLSELTAQGTIVKFQLVDKYCELHTDPEIIRNTSKKLSKKDVALFISLNGETQELVITSKNCYDSETGTIPLTANKYSSLMKHTETPFVGFKSEGSFLPDYEACLRLPLSILARILSDAYVLRTAT